MTTVKELREWLKQFPEDTEVEVGFQEAAAAYQAYGPVEFKSPTLTDDTVGAGWEFMDFRGNMHVKSDSPFFDKCFLTLGEKD